MAWTAPRTWVTGEVVTAANMNTHVRDNMLSLAQSFRFLTQQSGRYYSTPVEAFTTASVSANLLTAIPIFVPVTATMDRIAIEVTATGAGNARLGIYQDSGGLPGALVDDSGTVDVSSTGLKTITISEVLTGPANYWLAYISDVAPTVRVIGGHIQAPAASATPSGLAIKASWVRAFTYAALPDPFGTPDTDLAWGVAVAVRLS